MGEHFVILTKENCPWCERAKALIEKAGNTYAEFLVPEHPVLRDFLYANGVRTVPQVFLDGEWIGTYEDLVIWSQNDPDN